MITGSNSDVIARQLDEFSKEVQRRLTNMVAGFAREVALAASENTPVGNAADIIREGAYRNYYLDRQKPSPDGYGISAEAGYHSGAWQYTEGTAKFIPVIFSATEMANDVENEAEASYQLGNSFKIAAIGPGYADLEAGLSDQAPEGIGTPTMAQIQAAHQAQLKRYYDAG